MQYVIAAARRVIFRTSALKRTEHIAQNVGVKSTSKKHAKNPYMLKDLDLSPRIGAEGAGAEVGTEEINKKAPE